MIGVTLDSNVYVSALEFRGIGATVLALARAGRIRIDATKAIFDETAGVLRDRFRWEAYRLHFAGLELIKLANYVEPSARLAVAADPDDNRIIECAVTAGSKYILTQDSDLLRLGSYAGIVIKTPAAFLQEDM